MRWIWDHEVSLEDMGIHSVVVITSAAQCVEDTQGITLPLPL